MLFLLSRSVRVIRGSVYLASSWILATDIGLKILPSSAMYTSIQRMLCCIWLGCGPSSIVIVNGSSFLTVRGALIFGVWVSALEDISFGAVCLLYINCLNVFVNRRAPFLGFSCQLVYNYCYLFLVVWSSDA